MEELILNKARNTPGVTFNSSSGILEIEGRSIPENPNAFYKPLLDWINQYFRDPQTFTLIKIKLEYINSGSSRFLLAILRTVKQYYDEGHDCRIDWYYEEEDESILELGKHFNQTTKLPFNFIVFH
jgi:hypothetical protein